jgi:anaerobic selenocysteine-containing dehydrogenase
MNPKTAEELGVEDGDIVKVISPYDEIEAPVYVFPALRPDTISIPLGQGHSDYGRYARKRGSNPIQLVGTQTDDTGSGLAWANVRVKITKTGDKKALARLESSIPVKESDPLPF